MFLADACKPQYSQRRVLGSLQHQRVAGTECRGDLEGCQQNRRIPGDDGPDHADRLAPRVAQHVLAERDRLSFELTGEAAEVADDVGGTPGLRTRLGADGVTGLFRDDAGELLN